MGESGGRYRKLEPPCKEHAVWGKGDGASLAVYEPPHRRINGLNCREHKMVLAGYVLTPGRIRDIQRLICCLKYAKAVADRAETNSSRREFRGRHPDQHWGV